MRNYELVCLVQPDLDEAAFNALVERVKGWVAESGGSVDKVDVWGRRRLAYEIDKKADGIYAVIDMVAEPDTVRELDRQLSLNEAVLRTKILRPENH